VLELYIAVVLAGGVGIVRRGVDGGEGRGVRRGLEPKSGFGIGLGVILVVDCAPIVDLAYVCGVGGLS